MENVNALDYLRDLAGSEGLVFRPVRDEADADGIYALRAGCVERDQVDLLAAGEGLPGREEMRAALAELIAANRQDRWLVVEADGRIAGYGLVDSWHEEDGRRVYLNLGWVLPDRRGRGIGTALVRWGEATARRLAAADHAGQPFEFAANASSTQPDATALLLNEGYSVGYTVLEMGLDYDRLPPEGPLPAGFETRPAVPEHYPLIARSMQEAYASEYAGGRFQETSTLEEAVAGLSEPRQDPALWQIAWDGPDVVGQVIPLIERGRAILYDISVRPAWRRRGLARALLVRGLWDTRRRGVKVIRLNTVAEFPTRAYTLYESVGFRVLKKFPRYRKTPESAGGSKPD